MNQTINTTISCTDWRNCLHEVGTLTTQFNIFGTGTELIAIALTILFTAAVASRKQEWVQGIAFMYTLLFVIGFATKMWVLIAVLIMCGLYVFGKSSEVL